MGGAEEGGPAAMSTRSRSRQLTPRGVAKIEEQIAEQITRKNWTRERLLTSAGISKNTLGKLLKPEPVLAGTIEKVCGFLKITLDRGEDWQPVTAQEGQTAGTGAGRVGSVVGYPVSECMAKMGAARRVCFLNTWLVNKESFAPLLVEGAALRQVQTRLLFLDPLSPHVAHRGHDLRAGRLDALNAGHARDAAREHARQSVYDGIHNTLSEISDLAGGRADSETLLQHLHVRVYDSTPATTLLLIDDYACQGVYWRSRAEASTPHFTYTRQQAPDMYDAAHAHFEAVWNSASTYRYDIRARAIVRES